MALKVRTVTQFVTLTRDEGSWGAIISLAAATNADLLAGLSTSGYIVQSARIVTNPFGEYLDTSSSDAAIAGAGRLKDILLRCQGPTRLRVALGAARTPEEVALVPALVRAHGDVANCCVNLEGDALGLVDDRMVEASAAAVVELAGSTPGGAGNFNFTVNANVPPGCPFFPASYQVRGGALQSSDNGLAENENYAHGGLALQASGAAAMFTLGLEYTNLLVRTLSEPLPGDVPDDRRALVPRRLEACVAAVDAHLRVISVVATRVAAERCVSFGGLDSSAAPSKDCSSITDVFRLLGIPSFGAAGTLEVAALLTRGVFRALGEGIMPRAGFSGLSTSWCLAAWRESRFKPTSPHRVTVLACLEDEGLAAAAAAGSFDLRALLAYSAVCGMCVVTRRAIWDEGEDGGAHAHFTSCDLARAAALTQSPFPEIPRQPQLAPSFETPLLLLFV